MDFDLREAEFARMVFSRSSGIRSNGNRVYIVGGELRSVRARLEGWLRQ